MISLKIHRSGAVHVMGKGVPKNERDVKLSYPSVNMRILQKEYDKAEKTLVITFLCGMQKCEIVLKFSEDQQPVRLIQSRTS